MATRTAHSLLDSFLTKTPQNRCAVLPLKSTMIYETEKLCIQIEIPILALTIQEMQA